MSYNQNLQQNNTNLQIILESVNSLPNSNSGSNIIYGKMDSNMGQLYLAFDSGVKYFKVYFHNNQSTPVYDEIEMWTDSQYSADIYFTNSVVTGGYIEYMNGFLIAVDGGGNRISAGFAGMIVGIGMQTYNQDEEYTIYYKIEY